MLHNLFEEAIIRVISKVVKNLAVVVVYDTLLNDKFLKPIFSIRGNIVRSGSLLMAMLTVKEVETDRIKTSISKSSIT